MPTRDEMTDLQFMSVPDKWPLSFVLPMVQRDKETRHQISAGFLYQPSMAVPCPPPEPIVYIGNIFDKGISISKFPRKQYESLEAIANDGWEVD